MYIPIDSSWLQNSEYVICNRFDTCRPKVMLPAASWWRINSWGGDGTPKWACFSNDLRVCCPGLATVKLNVQVYPRLSIAVEFQCCQSRAACPISRGVNPMFHRSFFVFWGLCSKQKTAQKEWLHVIRHSDCQMSNLSQEENTRWRLKWTKIGPL